MNKIKEFFLIMGLGLVVVLLIIGIMMGIYKLLTHFGVEVFPTLFGGMVLLSAFMMGKIILKAFRDE
jgi:uncharacterized membrane protein